MEGTVLGHLAEPGVVHVVDEHGCVLPKVTIEPRFFWDHHEVIDERLGGHVVDDGAATESDQVGAAYLMKVEDD